MESGRIGHPVPREFYKERDVVQEERRMRIDSNPIGAHGGAVPGDGVCGASVSRADAWAGRARSAR